MINIKAALYIRVSTLEQATKGYSLDAQKEKLLAYAKSKGYDVAFVYVDDGYSAKDLNRPQMANLIDAVNSRLIDIVIVYKLDRLTRRVKDTLILVEDIFIPNNVQLFSLCENIDVSTPFGRAALKINATFSELERETIAERMMMGKEQAVKQGKYLCPGGNVPFGYTFNKIEKRLDIVSEEAEIVVELFDLYIQGYSFRKLYEYAKVNYRHPYFNNDMCCKAIIRRSLYSGYFTFKGELYKGNNFDAIISYETFLKAQAQIMKNTTVRHHDSSPYLLTGLLVCAQCGNRYVGKLYKNSYTRKDKSIRVREHRVYGCAARIKRDKNYSPAKCENIIYEAADLEKYVLKHVKALSFDSFANGAYINGLIDNLRIENSKVREQCDKLLDLYIDELIDKTTYKSRLAKLEKVIDKNDRIISEEEKKIIETPTLSISYIKEKQSQFDAMSHNEQRQFLALIIDNIALDGKNIAIKFKVK